MLGFRECSRLKRLRVQHLSLQGFLKPFKIFEEHCLAVDGRLDSPYAIVVVHLVTGE